MAITQAPPVDDVPFVDEQITQQQDPRAERGEAGRRAARIRSLRPILWRIHFLGGFLVAPIVLSLAVSGILFAWNPQLDLARFASIMQPSSHTASVPLSEQVQAARKAHPTWTVLSVVPGHRVSGAPDLNTAVLMDPPGGLPGLPYGDTDAVNVYVDQATGRAKGEIRVEDSSDWVLRNLHSSWTLGPKAEPLTELAGAWFLVSLLTGIYLWWPGLRKRGRAAFGARSKVRGRRRSKDWHNAIGVALVFPLVFLAVTGLTWSQFSGERYDGIKKAISAPVPAAVATTSTSQDVTPGAQDIDRVAAATARSGVQNPVRLSPPAAGSSSWTAASEDARFPIEQDQLAIDGASGKVTDRVDYSKEHALNKITTAGIAFHQAQLFGPPLQIAMTLLALAIIAMTLLGYRMWWQRRPRASFASPPPLRGWARNAPLSLLIALVVLAWLMPTLGLALVVWLVLERGVTWYRMGRGLPTKARRGAVSVPLRPGVEMSKAAGITVAGLAMVLGPHVGDDNDLQTIPRMLAWAWSVPLGVVFLAAGLAGLWAMFTVHGKPTERDRAVIA